MKKAEQTYPAILQQVATFVREMNFSASTSHDEGRRNSQVDEDKIVTALQKEFGADVILKEPQPRWWYDFGVADGENFYPVNYKSTASLASKASLPDNAGQKMGMLYALTTMELEPYTSKKTGILGYKLKGMNATRCGEDKFQQFLINHKGDSERDYYYLVQNKKDSSEVLLVGLRDMIVSNTPRNSSYNLPFQALWSENRDLVKNRTFEDSWNHVVGRYQNNVKEGVEVLTNGGILDLEVPNEQLHLVQGDSIITF